MLTSRTFSLQQLAVSATSFLSESKGFTDQHTKDLFYKTIEICKSKGRSEKEIIQNICNQLSAITGIPYIEWARELFPLDKTIEFSSVPELIAGLAPFLSRDEALYIRNSKVSSVDPVKNHEVMSKLENMLDFDFADQKWALLAIFAERGCTLSKLSIANLLYPLDCDNDPIISNSPVLSEKLFNEAFEAISDNSECHLNFITQFNTLICESKLKLALLQIDKGFITKAKLQIDYVLKNAANYSRARRYIKEHSTLKSIN